MRASENAIVGSRQCRSVTVTMLDGSSGLMYRKESPGWTHSFFPLSRYVWHTGFFLCISVSACFGIFFIHGKAFEHISLIMQLIGVMCAIFHSMGRYRTWQSARTTIQKIGQESLSRGPSSPSSVYCRVCEEKETGWLIKLYSSMETFFFACVYVCVSQSCSFDISLDNFVLEIGIFKKVNLNCSDMMCLMCLVFSLLQYAID